MSFSEWKEVRLGDACEINKSNYSIRDNWRFINYLDTGNITENKIDEIQYLVPGIDKIPSRAKRRVSINDIIYSTVRPNQRHYGIIRSPIENMLVSTGFAVITSRRDKADSQYLYYYLTQNNIVEMLHMLGEHSTSAYPSIKPSDIENLIIILPSLPEQKAISATLSFLDDKIELNNRINKNLEEMAQVIFKSWFVDFEPFQDGEFVDSELGRIPKGWRVGTIGELIFHTIGGDWGKDATQGNYTEEVICIRGADIPEIALGKKGKSPTRYILKKNLAKKRLSAGQIIIEISGGSPTQSTGRTAIINQELVNLASKPLICTNFCRALTMKKDYYSTFVYSMLQYLYNKDVFFLYENGTTGIKNLDIHNLFSRHLIVIPGDDTMIKYKDIFKTILKFVYENGNQADILSIIRDNLISKLMSGEIRVPIEEVQADG